MITDHHYRLSQTDLLKLTCTQDGGEFMKWYLKLSNVNDQRSKISHFIWDEVACLSRNSIRGYILHEYIVINMQIDEKKLPPTHHSYIKNGGIISVI